jgi:hypothetical protein
MSALPGNSDIDLFCYGRGVIDLDAEVSDGCVYRELRPYDYVTESPNVSGDDRSVLPLADPVRLAVQVEEPT